jgi:hypothetical protein
MNNNMELFTFQRNYATKKYLEYMNSQGYDMNDANTRIKLFWEKIDYYPTYEDECYKAAKISGRSLPVNTSKHPDYDYASRYAGISGDYIYSLICYATKLFNENC